MPKCWKVFPVLLLPMLLHGTSMSQGRIAFYSHRDGNAEIYVMHFDGTDPQRLTFDDGKDVCPDWSPDGEEIIFQSTQHGNFELYKVKATGGGVERLTFDPAGDFWPCCAKNLGRLEGAPLKIPASLGAQVDFALDAGKDHGGCWYLLLAGVSGTGPGIPLPGGSLMPLKWDGLTANVMSNANSAYFSHFFMPLDALGASWSRLDTKGPLDPLSVGLVMHFSYAVKSPPWWAASNAVAVEIVP